MEQNYSCTVWFVGGEKSKVIPSQRELSTSCKVRTGGAELLSPVCATYCMVTVLGWQLHTKAACSHTVVTKRNAQKLCGVAINTAQVHFAPCTFDMVQADGLNKTQQVFSILLRGNMTHRTSSCSTIPTTRMQSPNSTSGHSWRIRECVCIEGANDALPMTCAGICRWNPTWATQMKCREGNIVTVGLSELCHMTSDPFLIVYVGCMKAEIWQKATPVLAQIKNIWTQALYENNTKHLEKNTEVGEGGSCGIDMSLERQREERL